MSAQELVACVAGQEMGRVRQNPHGRLQFSYTESWRESPRAYPLSLSMPVQTAPHGHGKIEAFLWGLLPDNTSILQSWGRRFQVSARNAFGLISHVGEDCAGAVQFVRPERLEALQPGRRSEIDWLSERDIGERLRTLRTDHAAWRTAGDTGQFSLAGAQPKTALLFERGRWGVPSGRSPTTHILKPPNTQFDGFPENEHICLHLGRALGLPTAESRIMQFDGELAIVLTRYDRVRTSAGWIRVHQEDFCQAMGIVPTRKYQNDGGPGARAIIDLLRTYSSAGPQDEATFIDALALNWLIAGTDAHAKNFSILISEAEQIRLAPLYDVASILPYAQLDLSRAKLAMKVADEYRIQKIGAREWRKFATEFKLNPDMLVGKIATMAHAIPDTLADIARRSREDGLKHTVIDRLMKRLLARARLCSKQLNAMLG